MTDQDLIKKLLQWWDEREASGTIDHLFCHPHRPTNTFLFVWCTASDDWFHFTTAILEALYVRAFLFRMPVVDVPANATLTLSELKQRLLFDGVTHKEEELFAAVRQRSSNRVRIALSHATSEQPHSASIRVIGSLCCDSDRHRRHLDGQLNLI